MSKESTENWSLLLLADADWRALRKEKRVIVCIEIFFRLPFYSSNCVVNLTADKKVVLREAHKVLKVKLSRFYKESVKNSPRSCFIKPIEDTVLTSMHCNQTKL